MFRSKIPNPKKAQKLEKKGDRFFQKEKFEKALQYYRKSQKWDPNQPQIYQKLTESKGKIDKEWTQEDFEESMDWTMKQQELEHPEIKIVHQKFTQEYQAVQKLVQQLMLVPTADEEQQIITQILEYEEKAPLAVLDFLVSIKTLAHRGPPQPPDES